MIILITLCGFHFSVRIGQKIAPDTPATSDKVQDTLSQKETEAILFQERKHNYFRNKLLRQMKANKVDLGEG